ncbi:potassium voltage-gated channel subfamily KQT member 1-like isoform X3 [Dendronephthya gigantea]|uniref:potassium voltage-gated channel subfamily KQT member 1-like isoform X3 n=1 Tax=Dendronephthya gigantea TaxID=151771 RepID=UPI00106AFF90|nr:potassium voltage-gated channel subfamily KQT member 1-like isoform X3 [Dendronephthya gigantea]
MVAGENILRRIEHLWTCPNNDSIIIFIDPRKRSTMDSKYADRFDHYEGRNHLRICSVESYQKTRTRYKRIQLICYNFLERPNGILSVSYHFALFGLVVVGLVFAILETMAEFKDNDGLIMATYILEVFLLIVFTSEYVLRMWSAGCRSTYSGVLGRIRFAFKPFVIVDIIVIASTFGVIAYSSSSGNLSSTIGILRFFQVLRMVRFDRQGGSWKLLGSVLFLHRQELLTTFYIGFCSLIFASFFVWQAENSENIEFQTFADSFWWGVVTLTTVGYGDKVPKSWAGRGVAAFFAIMGISFFALPAGILGSGFALKVAQHQRQKHVKRRRRPAAMLIQSNWRYYASRKNSQLNATWSPYIKYLQETSTKKEDNIPEKPMQSVGRVRKISIFGRKASGQSSEGLHKPAESVTLEQTGQRTRRGLRSEIFPSNDSLHDGHSTAEQHTDEEHGVNHVRPILIKDCRGNVSLPPAYKRSIRFTRYLKFLVALRKFRLAKKPYDVKDVIEQYSTGHVEVLGKVKSIGNKIDEALGYKVGTDKLNDTPSAGRTNVVHRLSKLEKQVKTLESKVDKMITLLEDSKREREERKFCCGHDHSSKQRTTMEQLKRENLPSVEIRRSMRRRKIGTNSQNLQHVCLSERDELVSSEEMSPRNRATDKPCLSGGTPVNFESNGSKHLSPEPNYDDGSCYLSRQSSAYGISDNCPSPNSSSSDESYQSKDDYQNGSEMPHNGILPLYGETYQLKDDNNHIQSNDSIAPEYSEGCHEPEMEVPVFQFALPDGEQNMYENQGDCPQVLSDGETDDESDRENHNIADPDQNLVSSSLMSSERLNSLEICASDSSQVPSINQDEITVENNPFTNHGGKSELNPEYENLQESSYQDNCKLEQGLRTSVSSQEERNMSADDEKVLSPKRQTSPNSDTLEMKETFDSAFLECDNRNDEDDLCGEVITQSSDSEQMDRSSVDKSEGNNFGTYHDHIQETRM